MNTLSKNCVFFARLRQAAPSIPVGILTEEPCSNANCVTLAPEPTFYISTPLSAAQLEKCLYAIFSTDSGTQL